MKKYLTLVLLIFVNFYMASAQNVSRESQKKFIRVANAYSLVHQSLKTQLQSVGISGGELRVLIVGLKAEKVLKVYVAKKSSGEFQLFQTYSFCVLSGELGPKRKQGDLQVPEGFYYIDRFNPTSTFHLSLGINYPNASDRVLSDKKNPGGDIFIHGNCVSVGCIPITDERINELYVLCVEAAECGQLKIPVYLFPCEMNSEKMGVLKQNFSAQSSLIEFWKNLEQGYLRFEKNKRELRYSVNAKGEYKFTD